MRIKLLGIMKLTLIILIFFGLKEYMINYPGIFICTVWALSFYLIDFVYLSIFNVRLGFQASKFTISKNIKSKWFEGKQFLYFYIVWSYIADSIIEPKGTLSSFSEIATYLTNPLIFILAIYYNSEKSRSYSNSKKDEE